MSTFSKTLHINTANAHAPYLARMTLDEYEVQEIADFRKLLLEHPILRGLEKETECALFYELKLDEGGNGMPDDTTQAVERDHTLWINTGNVRIKTALWATGDYICFTSDSIDYAELQEAFPQIDFGTYPDDGPAPF